MPKKMNFVKEMPNKNGLCWYVDISYPDPKVGFICCGKFYDERMNETNQSYIPYIRFGDMLKKPSPKNMIVEQ